MLADRMDDELYSTVNITTKKHHLDSLPTVLAVLLLWGVLIGDVTLLRLLLNFEVKKLFSLKNFESGVLEKLYLFLYLEAAWI